MRWCDESLNRDFRFACHGWPLFIHPRAAEPYTVLTQVGEGAAELRAHIRSFVQKRNALIHAHPITADGGAQILNYQASLAKQISDMKWEVASLQSSSTKLMLLTCWVIFGPADA